MNTIRQAQLFEIINTTELEPTKKSECFFEKVECVDCLTLLKSLEDNSIDLIATDPPYCINYENIEWDKNGSLDWNIIAKECSRVLKDNGSIALFQGWSEVVKTKELFDQFFTLKNWIIYDRIKGRGTKTDLVSTREDILWYVNNERTYTYNKISSTIKKKTGGTIGKRNGNEFRALSNVWTDISPIVPWSKERVKHPTQKPLALMERIVNIFSNPTDVILDPFMGSGTTLVAAKKLGRNYIGCDKEQDFYMIAKERLKNVG